MHPTYSGQRLSSALPDDLGVLFDSQRFGIIRHRRELPLGCLKLGMVLDLRTIWIRLENALSFNFIRITSFTVTHALVYVQ